MLQPLRRHSPRQTFLSALINHFMRLSGRGNLPVRATGGLISGARWTLYPFSSYWRGTSDREAIEWIDLFCRSGGATLDLGAHFGLYTVAMAQRVGAAGQVVSLEPEATARSKCLRHVRMNGLNQAMVFAYAASSANGVLRLVGDEGLGSTTSFVSKDLGRGVATPCIRLDDLYARESLRLPEFIKVDVENHGAEALSGAPHILESRPNILMSFHSEEELSGTEAILKPLGYHVVSMSGANVDWAQALYRTAILTTLENPASLGDKANP